MPLSSTLTLAPASALPLKVGVVARVMPSLLELPESLAVSRAPVVPLGAVLSTVNAVPVEVLALPAVSVTVMDGV